MKFVGKFAYIFYIVLVIFLRNVFSGGPPVLDFDSFTTIFARAGENLTVTAIAQPSNFASYQLVEVSHRNTLTNTERTLARLQDYTTILISVDGYEVSVVEVSWVRRDIILFIESLSLRDDGAILFHLESTSGATTAMAERLLTVVVSPLSVKIQFGNYGVVDTNSTQAVEVSSGNVTVYCIVEESNPAITDIRLILNGDGVTLATGPDSELVSTDERKYSTSVSAILEIPDNITGTQTLACVAVDHFGDLYSIQLLYELNSAREGQRPVLEMVVSTVIAFLLYIE